MIPFMICGRYKIYLFYKLRLAEGKNKERFSELPLYQLREQYEKTKQGKKFLKESILQRDPSALYTKNMLTHHIRNNSSYMPCL